MAHSKESWEEAKALFMRGDSLSSISEQTGISKSQIGKAANKDGWGKETIKDLAKAEVDNIIIGNEITRQKETLSPKERRVYDEVFIDMKTSLGVFNNAATLNQALVNIAQQQIAKQVEADEDAAIEHLPNIMAANRITESNRKQVLGQTDGYKPPVDEDKKAKRVGMGDLYKSMNEKN